jgi:hypothetical protein
MPYRTCTLHIVFEWVSLQYDVLLIVVGLWAIIIAPSSLLNCEAKRQRRSKVFHIARPSAALSPSKRDFHMVVPYEVQKKNRRAVLII